MSSTAVIAFAGRLDRFESLKQGRHDLATLQNETLLALPLLSGGESSTGGVLKDFSDTFVGLG